ncbi:hypothetical protein KUL42_39300 [Alteromonas sp. KUL42]|nr:hypothetical protein KUL42_39300 [Alteromonas sp. KUL42]
MLPDVSSTSTVHKYFANWKKELEANQQSLYDKLGFSSEFTQSFMKEITRFGVEAEQRYKEQAQDANEQRDLALDDLERSEDRLHKQNSLVSQLEREVAELQQELATVKAEAKSELQKTNELNRAALDKENETHTAIVTELRQQLTQSTQEAKSLHQTNEELRTEIAKAELKLEGNQQYVDEVKAQNAALVDDNKLLNKELAAINKTLASQETELTVNSKLINSLESSTNEYKKYMASAESELSSLKLTNQHLSKQLETVTEKLDRANTSNTELRKTLEEQSSVIAKLTK